MKNIKTIFKALFLVLAVSFVSCDKETYEFGEMTAPSNLEIMTSVVGADDTNPAGDGSGLVNVSFHADNAITYKVFFDGREFYAPSGSVQVNAAQQGIKDYNINVVAYGKGGTSTSDVAKVTVLYTYTAPADLLEMLHNGEGGSRTWRVKAEGGGHFGVGPADADTPIWWSAGAYDKDGKGGYDDRIVFHSDGTVDYLTNGAIYGKADPLVAAFPNGDPNWGVNGDGEFENWPMDDFSDTWMITAPGDQETLTFNGNGFHGFFVGGDHSYAILKRSSNEMSIRTVGADGLGWFGILIAVD